MPEVHRIVRLQLEAGDAFQNFGFHTQMNALRIPVHDAYSSKDRQVTIVENGHGGQRHCPMQQVMLQPAETWIGKFCLWYRSIAPPPPHLSTLEDLYICETNSEPDYQGNLNSGNTQWLRLSHPFTSCGTYLFKVIAPSRGRMILSGKTLGCLLLHDSSSITL
jgi:hypothetical protein